MEISSNCGVFFLAERSAEDILSNAMALQRLFYLFPDNYSQDQKEHKKDQENDKQYFRDRKGCARNGSKS
jgi:hypothetical protein